MSVSAKIKSAGLLHAGGFTAIVAALAMAIAPTGAMAQERGKWQGGGQQSAQSQRGGDSGGAWRGNRGGDGGGASVRSRGASTSDNGNVRGRSFRGDAAGQANVQRSPQQNPAWSNRTRAQDSTVARARMEQAQRRTETVRQAQPQRDQGQQWSGRNRTYSDQNRNRTYRQGVRDGNRND